jgi:peptide-methionine (S)-S-oxide reductase
MKRSTKSWLALAAVAILFLMVLERSAHAATPLPSPAVDEQPTAGTETVVLAGGCFWGIQGVFEHVKGVKKVTAGYSGGNVKNPDYEEVSSGDTGHAESVEIVYDPSKVTFGQLLQVFFSVAHDPTELNRQGPDEGTNYRSAIFFETPDQERIAKAYVAQLTDAKAFSHKIVTEITPYKAFYRAEDYHQDFMVHNPSYPYIVINDAPKVSNLKKEFPNLYVNYP